MVSRHRDLSEKYKALRLQPDPLFHSRVVKTLFNKFIKKGNKAFSNHQVVEGLANLRCSLHRPPTFDTIFQILDSLHVQFILAAKREGRKMINVPVPVRRNKAEIAALQTLYRAVAARNDRSLADRFLAELTSLTVDQEFAPTLRQKSQYLAKVYEERVNMEKR